MSINLFPNVYQALFYRNYNKKYLNSLFKGREIEMKKEQARYIENYKSKIIENERKINARNNLLFQFKRTPIVVILKDSERKNWVYSFFTKTNLLDFLLSKKFDKLPHKTTIYNYKKKLYYSLNQIPIANKYKFNYKIVDYHKFVEEKIKEKKPFNKFTEMGEKVNNAVFKYETDNLNFHSLEALFFEYPKEKYTELGYDLIGKKISFSGPIGSKCDVYIQEPYIVYEKTPVFLEEKTIEPEITPVKIEIGEEEKNLLIDTLSEMNIESSYGEKTIKQPRFKLGEAKKIKTEEEKKRKAIRILNEQIKYEKRLRDSIDHYVKTRKETQKEALHRIVSEGVKLSPIEEPIVKKLLNEFSQKDNSLFGDLDPAGLWGIVEDFALQKNIKTEETYKIFDELRNKHKNIGDLELIYRNVSQKWDEFHLINIGRDISMQYQKFHKSLNTDLEKKIFIYLTS